MAKPNWGPAEQKELDQPHRLESTVVEGSVRSEVGVHRDPHLEEKARAISGNLMGK